MAENIVNYRLVIAKSRGSIIWTDYIYLPLRNQCPEKIHTRSARVCMSTDTWRT